MPQETRKLYLVEKSDDWGEDWEALGVFTDEEVAQRVCEYHDGAMTEVLLDPAHLIPPPGLRGWKFFVLVEEHQPLGPYPDDAGQWRCGPHSDLEGIVYERPDTFGQSSFWEPYYSPKLDILYNGQSFRLVRCVARSPEEAVEVGKRLYTEYRRQKEAQP